MVPMPEAKVSPSPRHASAHAMTHTSSRVTSFVIAPAPPAGTAPLPHVPDNGGKKWPMRRSPFGGEYQHPDIGVGAEASNDVSQIETARDGERVHRRVVHHYLGDSLRNRV